MRVSELPRVAFLVLPMACAGSGATPLDVFLVGAEGRTPLADRSGMLTFEVRQAGVDAPERLSVPVREGAFALDLRLPNLSQGLAVRARFDGSEGEALAGALPAFVPVEAAFGARLALLPAGRCSVLEFARPGSLPAGFALVRFGTFALAAGGRDGRGEATEGAASLDLLQLAFAASPLALEMLGEARGAREPGSPSAVLVGELAALRLRRDGTREVLADAPLGASAVAGGRAGVLVVGGAAPRAMARLYRDLDGDGREDGAVSAPLVVPRAGAGAVALLGDGDADGAFVVAGGGPGDAAPAELLSAAGRATAVGLPEGVRDAPVVLPLRDGAYVLGGTDAAGVARTDGLRVAGCPEACALLPGPRWETARAGVGVAPELGLIAGGAPGDPNAVRVEAVEAEEVVLRHTLVHGRERPGLVALADDVLLVLGGRDAAGPRDDVEICVGAGP